MRYLLPLQLLIMGVTLLICGLYVPSEQSIASGFLVFLGVYSLVLAVLVIRYELTKAKARFDLYRDRADRHQGGTLREW